MYPYTLLGVSLESNTITVKNNIVAGAPLQLDCAFVLRSGRAEKMFSPEDIDCLTQATGLTVATNEPSRGKADSTTKLRLVA
ncbi:hypothetical protein [Alkalimarinus coralli]|uniref:hypothetical protein n=1 Tax=Alkalimarinus coralli TaxID=2935863 RepID=UPI00202B9778|nr:hypothetical protein [Alkalimarinus coralli]